MKQIQILTKLALMVFAAFSLSGCVMFGLDDDFNVTVEQPTFSNGGFGGGYSSSTVDISRVGFGTVVSGTSENYLVESDSSIDRDGYSIGGYYRFSPRVWGFASYEYADGDSRASASISEGGTTDHGLTFLDEYNFTGGSSTGIFAGNASGLDGNIFSSNSWSIGHIGLATHVPVEDVGIFTGSVSLFAEDFEQNHEARVDATLNGVAVGDLYQQSRIELQDDFLGLSFDGSITVPLQDLGGTYFTFGGFGQLAQRDGSGRAWQMTQCGPCGTGPTASVTQNFNYSEDDTTFNYGVRFNVGYQFDAGFVIQAGYEKSWLGDVGMIMTPANPNQQPLNYGSDDVERDFIRVGAGYRF